MATKLTSLALLTAVALAWGPLPSSWSEGGQGHLPITWYGDRPTPTVTSPLSVSTVVSNESPVAKVLNGTYTGVYQPTYQQDFFLGIPFAQSPVGELRFRVPQSLNSTWSGSRTAAAYQSSCIGYGTDQVGYPISEDCLYLNIIRPAANISTNAKLPVALWIHGGGFVEGGGGDKRYNMSFIVHNSVTLGKPFIAVSINYRLSAWGFLSSKEVVGSGQTNLGLRDQRLAMHWVQENIAAFGGDPTKVTIWGESAGAASVGFHLTAYNGRNDKLFRGAVMESGGVPFYGTYRFTDASEPLYQNLTTAVGCANSLDTLECLRTVSYATLNAAINGTGLGLTGWGPVIDGDFVAKQTSIQVANGDFVKVAILIGANEAEGTAFSPQPVNNVSQLVSYIQGTTGLVRPLAQEIADSYSDNICDQVPDSLGCIPGPASNGALWRKSASIFGDLYFIANRRYSCQQWAAYGVPAYCYRFNAIPAGLSYIIGPTHFQEVAFVFDNLAGVGYPPFATPPFTNKSQSYTDLASLMSNSWVSFFVDQNPNSYRLGNNSIAQWPTYNNANPQDFVFDANVTSHVEADTFRGAGIAKIISLNVARGV